MADVLFLFVLLCGWFSFELSRRFLLCKSLSNSVHHEKSNNALQYIDVIIPDMFQTFLKAPPRVNPHYKAVKLESEKWLSRFANSLRCTAAIVNADTVSAHMGKGQKILCTVVTSHTLFLYPPLLHLRSSFGPSVTGATGYVSHILSTGSWTDIVDPQVFPYDDSTFCEVCILSRPTLMLAVFDNGHLKDRPGEARRVMDSLMAAMDGNKYNQPKLKIVEAHDTVVKRIAAVWCSVSFLMIFC